MASESGCEPEHVAIVGLCHGSAVVAEIAAHLDLPVGTVRVLLGDLVPATWCRSVSRAPRPPAFPTTAFSRR